jgi:hypothetical protein
MRPRDGGYIGLISLLVVTAIVAVWYFMRIPPFSSGTATSTPDKVGQSSVEIDLKALENTKALQDVSAKRAAEINAQMQ